VLAVELAIEDFTWSFSRLSSYAQCPQGFHLQYIDCKPDIENAFSQYGSYNHQLLEDYANGKLEVYELLDEYRKGYYDSVTERFPPNQYVDQDEKYFNQGHEYFENFEGFDDLEILGIEEKLRFMLGDKYKFVGIIDLVVRDSEGNLCIIDHKSKTIFKRKCVCELCEKNYSLEAATKRDFTCIKKCKGRLNEIITEEMRDFLRQLYLYSIPVYEKYGEYPKKLIFNFFREGGFWATDFNIKTLEEAKAWAVDTIESIRNDEKFAPNVDGFFCKWICGQRRNCRDSDQYLGV